VHVPEGVEVTRDHAADLRGRDSRGDEVGGDLGGQQQRKFAVFEEELQLGGDGFERATGGV
jgi:hypothetical protein